MNTQQLNERGEGSYFAIGRDSDDNPRTFTFQYEVQPDEAARQLVEANVPFCAPFLRFLYLKRIFDTEPTDKARYPETVSTYLDITIRHNDGGDVEIEEVTITDDMQEESAVERDCYAAIEKALWHEIQTEVRRAR